MLTEFAKIMEAMREQFEQARRDIHEQANQALADLRKRTEEYLDIQIPPPMMPGPRNYITVKTNNVESDSIGQPTHTKLNMVLDRAESAIGKPYKYGGGNDKGPTVGIVKGEKEPGFDCSGLVVYAFAGLTSKPLPRTTGEQYKEFEPIDAANVMPGVLAYTNFKGDVPGHVSIMAGKDTCIEAGDPVDTYPFIPQQRGRVEYALPYGI